MSAKPEDIEYIVRDYLEVRYGINELENTRIVQFLMNRVRISGRFYFCPVYGFLIDGILVCVVSSTSSSIVRECLLLNHKTGEHTHYQQVNMRERLIW